MRKTAILIQEDNIDAIAELNGDVRPDDSTLETPTYFIWAELDDTCKSDIIGEKEFLETYTVILTEGDMSVVTDEY
jgi:hypothetical protein